MSTTPNLVTTPQASLPGTRRIMRTGTVIGAAVVAAAVRLVAGGVLHVVPVAAGPAGPAPIGVPAVIAAALVAGLLGWALLALCERILGRRGFTVWLVIAFAFTLLSLLLGPTTATTAAGGIVLAVLHVVVSACVIIGFVLSRRQT